jgi:hypothetical protein
MSVRADFKARLLEYITQDDRRGQGDQCGSALAAIEAGMGLILMFSAIVLIVAILGTPVWPPK